MVPVMSTAWLHGMGEDFRLEFTIDFFKQYYGSPYHWHSFTHRFALEPSECIDSSL